MPPLSSLGNPPISVSSQIYSKDGRLLGNFYDEEHRINIRYKHLPKTLIDALIATEDVRFKEHNGIDLQSSLGILSGLIYSNKLRGGSTITQQLARNLYASIGNDKSIFRKIKEGFVSIFLERYYTKEEIIMFYFNSVNFGGNIHGIQTASKYYFNKDCYELSVEESALLVGMLKGPSIYHPIKQPKKALERRNVVLSQMAKYDFIKSSDLESYKKIPLKVNLDYKEKNILPSGLAGYFRASLKIYLEEWCKNNHFNLYRDGLRIYTTLDARMQDHAEKAMQKHLPKVQAQLNQEFLSSNPFKDTPDILLNAMTRSPRYHILKNAGNSEEQIRKNFDKHVLMKVFTWDKSKNYETDTLMTPWDSLKHYASFMMPGMITIDPTTGHVLTWVGGLDSRFFPYDNIKQEKRTSGTAFMPFVYAAAFESGMNPCDVVENMPISIKTPEGDMWTPKNIGGRLGGNVNLKEALLNQYNIIAARLTQKITPEKLIEICSKLGINSPLKAVPSISLGTADLNLFEMTSAYAAFANLGVWRDPIYVTRIENKYGNVLADFTANSRPAVNPNTAYSMIELMKYIVNSGYGSAIHNYNLGAIEAVGVSGRTQSHSDSWYFGMTPTMSTGIWVGNIDRRVCFDNFVMAQGTQLCLPMWGEFMQAVLNDPTIQVNKKVFEKPKGYPYPSNCGGKN